jgi:hypothetical protein
MKRLILIVVGLISFAAAAKGLAEPKVLSQSLSSGDAFARFDPEQVTWTFGTSLIEQQVQLAQGKFYLTKLTNRRTGTNFVAGTDADEFQFLFAGREQSGRTGPFTFKDSRLARLPVPQTSAGIEPGVELIIILEHPLFQISLHYEVFASTSRTPLGIIKKWYTVLNKTLEPRSLSAISMNHFRVKSDFLEQLRLYHWQGGGAEAGTNQLIKESLSRQRNRTFFSMAGATDFRVDDIYDGSASYHPFFILEDSKTGEGLFWGFNYLGPWSMRVWNPTPQFPGHPSLLVQSQLELHTETLAPGASFEVPNSFVGVYQGDLDSVVEQMQDWQATFKWDLTREQYLWTTAIYNGHWDDLKHRQKTDLHIQEMWRIADLCLHTGAQIAHEDDFWFDERGRGVWEGIDWAELVSYLRQSGILFRLWMPPQHFAPGTPPDVSHPEWGLVPKASEGITAWYGYGFCVASQGAHDYMKQFMLDRENRYGDYYYRLDGWVQAPCWAENHDHQPGQPHLAQYRHYLNMLREVKTANPRMGLQGCNSGGEWCNWDKLEILENNQASDGGGPDDRYYLSYFWPIAKLMESGVGSTELEGPAIDQLRADVLIRRYLRQERVLDRYMRVYHPLAEGVPNEHCYLQLMNAECTKGVILQDELPKSEVRVFPKRLQPVTSYTVTWRYGPGQQTQTGSDWMKQGIHFHPEQKGEMVYLNLASPPGKGMDHTPPTAPQGVHIQGATYHEQAGVALQWQPSRDNILVAEYQIRRDARILDRVAIGTFYFDHSVGNGLERHYEIVAVDGDGNRSSAVSATKERGDK